MGEPVGHLNVVQGGFEVAQWGSLARPRRPPGGLLRALMLVQQGQRINQGQILLVIAPRAGGAIDEGQPLGVGVDNGDGFQQPLGVAV